MLIAAAAESAQGSLISKHRIPFESCSARYFRSSLHDFQTLPMSGSRVTDSAPILHGEVEVAIGRKQAGQQIDKSLGFLSTRNISEPIELLTQT